MSKYLFTSESVTEGHPDKACDAISDAILDHILSKDPEAHVACETLATKGVVVVSGEVRTNGSTEVEKVVKPPKKPIIKKDFKNSLFESFNKKKNIPIKKDPVTFTISVDNGKLELEIKFTVPI